MREPPTIIREHGSPRSSESDDAFSPDRRWTLADLSRDGAEVWPDVTALRDGACDLTFAALHDRVCALATALVARGVARGDRVAILGVKQVDTVVAMLAAASAGAAYVPLDPRLPPARIRFMLDDVDARLVLGPGVLAALAGARPFVAFEERAAAHVAGVELPSVHPDDPAYLLYTSGSTGRPKAVVIAHCSVRAFFEAHNAFADIQPGDRCLNTGGFHFDVSVLDVLLPLHVGATVTLTPELLLPTLVLGLLERERITHVYAVGTVLARITGDGSALDRHRFDALRMLQTGAERCNPHVVNAWLTRYPDLGFLNSYGPTELTVGCLCYRKQEPGVLTIDDVPIGVVHAGSEARLVDEAGTTITAPGQVGELLVSGAQVMRGYWNRPEEEQRVCVVIDGTRHYRTGDRMFVDDDGRYHFVGRDDDCVKIEGVRLSLSEVERLLESRAEVQRAVAFVVRAASRTRVAVAVQSDETPSFALAEALRAFAEAELPAIAVPVATLITAQLPRASSGKADVRLLATRTAAAIQQTAHRVFRLDDAAICPLVASEERPA